MSWVMTTGRKVQLVFAWASWITDRTVSYPDDRSLEHEQGQLCATCAARPASLVLFTVTESGCSDVVFGVSACGRAGRDDKDARPSHGVRHCVWHRRQF